MKLNLSYKNFQTNPKLQVNEIESISSNEDENDEPLDSNGSESDYSMYKQINNLIDMSIPNGNKQCLQIFKTLTQMKKTEIS